MNSPLLLLVVGGYDETNELSSVELFDPFDSSHNQSYKVNDFPVRCGGMVAAYFDNQPLVCGGYNYPTDFGGCFRLFNDEWEFFGNMVTPRDDAGGIILGDNSWWIIGGDNQDDKILQSSEILF